MKISFILIFAAQGLSKSLETDFVTVKNVHKTYFLQINTEFWIA